MAARAIRAIERVNLGLSGTGGSRDRSFTSEGRRLPAFAFPAIDSMKRLKNFLPILVLIALGIALLASGVLNRFRPSNLAQEQAHLQELIALHPVLAAGAFIIAVTLAISTGVPGVVVLILAGGMLFGVW